MTSSLPRSVHVDSGRGLRSSQRQVLYLLRGLRQRGADVLLCCPKAGRLHQRAQDAGIPTATLTIRSGMDFPSTVRLARLLGEWPAEVLHAHDTASHAVARAAQGMSPDHAPAFGMARSCYDIDEETSLNRLQSSDPMLRWIASAPRIRSQLENRGVPPHHIDVIPHAVDLQTFDGLRRRQADPWGLRPQADIVVGTVGHLTRRRNVALLLQAFSRLRRGFPGARLLIVGAGPQTRTLHKLARSLEMTDAVMFAGASDDLRAIYATLDVFVLSSDLEVSGQALLDAMAAGIPVVCTASAGVLGLARHGETALVVPPRDIQALSDSMARVLQDDELAQSIAAGARQIAERHSIEALTDRTLESYQKLAAQHRSAHRP